MHLFKVHWHTRMPGAKLDQGSWPWASPAPLLRSLPGPLAIEVSPLLLPTLIWLWLIGDWAHLQQLVGTCLTSTT